MFSLVLVTAQPPTPWLGITAEGWLTVAAVLLGPVLAVQAQKWVERKRDDRARKTWLFRELMATRGTRLSPRFVDAINLVELEFNPRRQKQKRVHEAWRSYFDSLDNAPNDPGGLATHVSKREDLFVELIYEMGHYLGFQFDRVAIKRNSYTPVGHLHLETDLAIIRKGFAKIFTAKGRAVPIHAVDQKYTSEPLVTAADIYSETPLQK